MIRRTKWDPERKKTAIKPMRNKEMGSYKASRIFNLPQTTLQSYAKDRESSSDAIKQKWVGSKFFHVKKNYLAEHCLLMERKCLGLTMADVMCIAYQLALRNGIKNQICTRNERTGRKRLKNFLHRHQEISVTRSSLSRARGFTPESVAQYI
jgi:hypothetical protein